MSKFNGKVVLITGAGKGLGREAALAFAAQGAIVAANDITPVNLDETVLRIRANNGRVKDYVYDIAKKMPVQGLVQQVIADWGRIDILINHARVRPRAPLLAMDEWDWHRTLDVNLSGAFYTLQSVGRVMREQGGGVMVNLISSTDCSQDMQEYGAFAASMQGLIGLTCAVAGELAAFNIRLNALSIDLPEGNRPPSINGCSTLERIIEKLLFFSSYQAAALTGQVVYLS